jgi:hypothetical protein
MTTQPSWLALVTPLQRAILVRLLVKAQRSQEEQANIMLTAPPWPTDQADAKARSSAVIEYLLMDGYRVGDRHPSLELE